MLNVVTTTFQTAIPQDDNIWVNYVSGPWEG